MVEILFLNFRDYNQFKALNDKDNFYSEFNYSNHWGKHTDSE